MHRYKNSRKKRGIIEIGVLTGVMLIFMNVSAAPMSMREPVKTAQLQEKNRVAGAIVTNVNGKSNSLGNFRYEQTVANLNQKIEQQRQETILNGDAAEAVRLCTHFYTAEDYAALNLPRVKAAEGAQLYLQADASSEVLHTFGAEESVKLLYESEDGNFYYVEYNDLQRGYIACEDLDVSILSAAQRQQVNLVNRCRFAAWSEQDVYLWTAPDETGEAVIVESGVLMAVTGLDGEWLQVSAADFDGYIRVADVQLDRMLTAEVDSEGYIRSARAAMELRQQEEEAAAAAAQQAQEMEVQESQAAEEIVEIASTPETPASSAIGEAMVSTAMNYLGVPYVYGGASPSGFDCSGLVYYCALQNGRTLPRCADEQYYAGGTYVSFENLAVGDLVFFSADWSYEIEHVGIYVGGGQFIHAPHTGDVVKISGFSDYYIRNYWGALRLS